MIPAWRGRRAVVTLLLVLAAAFLLRLGWQSRESGLASDSCQYLSIARSVARGDGFASGGSQHPDLSRPPVYPVALAFVEFAVRNPETAAWLFGALFSALAIWPLCVLARDLFGVRAGTAAAALGVFSCLLSAGGRFLPTAPFLALSLGTAATAWRGARSSRTNVLFIAGILAGLAALTRMEGIVWAPALILWILVAPPPAHGRPHALAEVGRRVRLAVWLLAGAAMVYVPYAAWASTRLGRPVVSPGLEYIRLTRVVADRLGLRELPGSSLDWAYNARVALTADHRDLVLDATFRDGVMPVGDTESVNVDTARPEIERESWIGIALRRLVIVLQNLRELPYAIRATHFAPIPIVLLAAAGLVRALARRRQRSRLPFLAMLAALSLVPVASHIEARFLYEMFAVMLLFAANGWAWIDRIASGPILRPLLRVAMAAFVIATGLSHPLGGDPHPERISFLRSEAARVQLPKGAMMAVQPQFPFLAGRRYRAIPLGTPDDVLEYGLANGATTLAFEGSRDLERRPALAPLLADPPPPGFRLLHSAPYPNGGELRVFAIGP